MAKKVAVILFPGSNCELEALRACKRSKLEPTLIRWNDDYSILKKFDAFILPGGFSYEDRGRSGIVASKDPIIAVIEKEAFKGKPLLGICNGAQILVETGLIPGINIDQLQMSLAPNERFQKGKILGVGYYNDWVHMKNCEKPGRSAFNNFSQQQILNIPIAHGEGRFVSRDQQVLKNLIKNKQTLFRYCNTKGEIINEFPVNPNGAMYNLAGICNPEGNVLALMPHPERTVLGQPIFDSLANFLQTKKVFLQKTEKTPGIKKQPVQIEKIKKKPDITILIRLIITDNEERTLESALHKLGYPKIILNRQIYLGIFLKNRKNIKKTTEELIKSGEILNLNKETATIFIGNKAYSFEKEKGLQEITNPLRKNFHFHVTEYNNYSGRNIQETLKHHLHGNNIEKIERGVFWTLQKSREKDIVNIISTYLFHNPHSMKVSSL